MTCRYWKCAYDFIRFGCLLLMLWTHTCIWSDFQVWDSHALGVERRFGLNRTQKWLVTQNKWPLSYWDYIADNIYAYYKLNRQSLIPELVICNMKKSAMLCQSVFEADLCEAERQWRSSSSGWQVRLEGLATQRSRREPWNRQTNKHVSHASHPNKQQHEKTSKTKVKKNTKQKQKKANKTARQNKNRQNPKAKQKLLTEKADTHTHK